MIGDLRVLRLGFGAMRLTGPGTWGPPSNRSEALTVLRRAIELGVNLIDTADAYGPGIPRRTIERSRPRGSGARSDAGTGGIPGTTSPRHLEENIGARDLRLTEGEMDGLEHYRPSELARRRRSLRHALRPVAVPVVASLLSLRSRSVRDP